MRCNANTRTFCWLLWHLAIGYSQAIYGLGELAWHREGTASFDTVTVGMRYDTYSRYELYTATDSIFRSMMHCHVYLCTVFSCFSRFGWNSWAFTIIKKNSLKNQGEIKRKAEIKSGKPPVKKGGKKKELVKSDSLIPCRPLQPGFRESGWVVKGGGVTLLDKREFSFQFYWGFINIYEKFSFV